MRSSSDVEPAAAGSQRRRVLFLSYYFPPAGGPGVQRALKFARYLPEFGWEPIILTVAQGAYPEHDETLVDEIPDDLRIVRAKAWGPYRAYAKLKGSTPGEVMEQGSVQREEGGWRSHLVRWIRANIFIPDARVGWVPGAMWSAREVIRRVSIDAILTTGPPHSTHLAGRLLAWRSGLPWLADFRDPWTDINYYDELPHSRLARLVDGALERHVLNSADAVVTVSPSWRQLLADKATRSKTRFSVVENGFDPPDVRIEAHPPEDRFVISHVGSLYASRNPRILWDVLGHLRKQGTMPRLQLKLVGAVDDSVRAAVRRNGLESVTSYTGYVSHNAAVSHMKSSHLLLLSIEPFRHDRGMITGKLYEYLSSGRPILGIGPPDGDAADILDSTEAGEMAARDDGDRIAYLLSSLYSAWKNGGEISGADENTLQRYTRRARTKELAQILDRIVPETK